MDIHSDIPGLVLFRTKHIPSGKETKVAIAMKAMAGDPSGGPGDLGRMRVAAALGNRL